MEFKGTKGKWIVDDNNVYFGLKTIACAYGFTVKGKYVITDECKANTLLISKAPEMLEMLQRIEKILTYETIEPNSPIQLEIFELIKETTQLK